MKVIASDSAQVEIQFEGGHAQRREGGTFSVPDSLGRAMLKGGEYGRAGTRMASAPGWRCTNPACRHLGVFAARCGRCGGTDLERED